MPSKTKTKLEPVSAERVSRAKLGPIRADELWPKPALSARLGLGEHALREMRRQGLRTIRCGRCVFVLGSDLIAFLERSGEGGGVC